MIIIHEKILQYFKTHNIGNDIKLTSNDNEEDKNKTLKTQETIESEVAVEPNSTSTLKDDFIKKLNAQKYTVFVLILSSNVEIDLCKSNIHFCRNLTEEL